LRFAYAKTHFVKENRQNAANDVKEYAMKTGEAAKLLDIVPNTLKNWIENPAVTLFFSAGAKGQHGGAQRILSESDILTLNTIRRLRNIDNVSDWEAIAAFLETGNREQEFPVNAINVDTRMIPIPHAEVSAKYMATIAERNYALNRVKELEAEFTLIRAEHEEKLEKERSDRREEVDELQEKIAQLNREIGGLEATVVILKERDKRDKE
jgi:DNA-binding transcriptional MerR regulator